MRDLWYKNAVIYCLDVDTFADGNGDGVGDFRGLARRLDHIAGLGATCIWLLPFYRTPNRDNGYDISDYYQVDPRLGTLGDFVEFTHLAKDRGLRVIADLVVNHTSTDHPWFQAARSDPDSPYRDFYLWSEEKPADAQEGMVFPGVQETVWTWDEKARSHYFHRFYDHEPDLNVENPAVREEIERIMGAWLQLGVSGFRIDGAPFLIESDIKSGKSSFRYDYLAELRSFLSWRRGDAVMLAEANVEPKETCHYFGGGDRLHMMFNFWLNQRLFLAFVRHQAGPVAEALGDLPELPSIGQWANFLRNHDELDLGRLSDAEREEVFAAMAPEEEMRAYGRGIRRRLAPMLGNDRRRLELAYSLMFSLPGTPVIWYGEEIGMGEDLSLDERNAVRTPMQWSDDPNGGFSPAPPDRLVRPVLTGGEYGYERVNVEAQQRDPGSLLNWFERVARARRECPEFGRGAWRVLETGDPAVLALRCDWDGKAVLALHNFAAEERTATLADPPEEPLRDLFGDRAYEPAEGGKLSLSAYGYRWLRLDRRGH
ncbi:MAG TPA: alpha-amylase family protein [Azospirillaceae bacterium]|nr:alpha-amylase family protein [Azospirillaceae bacterium]